jgi:flagellar hook-length control protein FliK
MNTISTASNPAAAAAAPPMAVRAPLPATPAHAAPACAMPVFFAQFLGLEAAAGADAPQEAGGAPEGAVDAAPADAPEATQAADMPGMAMLMMPPAVQAPVHPGYAVAEPEANTTAAAPPAAAPAAIAAPAAAAGAAAVSAPLAAVVPDSEAAAPDAAPAPACAAGFASAGAIALPTTTITPVRTEQPVPGPAAKPGAEALPDKTAKTAESPARSFAADAGAWAVAAPVAPAAAPAVAAAVPLEGAPQQWQQTLRDALGERLQAQVGRNSEQAVIRLDPPQLGRIEISIRHSAGALQVTLSATHGEVLRQLHTIGDSVRQQLSQQAFTDVALVVTSAPARSGAAQSFADGGGRQRGSEEQRQPQRDDAQPGRALSEAGQPAATFAMQPERNHS